MGELKDKARRYTEAFDSTRELGDELSRAKKAAKIRAVLSHEHVLEKPGLKLLDIGCSFGLILKDMTPTDGLGVGIDIDQIRGVQSYNVYFVRTDAEELPFGDKSFDVIVCNHVYEHTDDAERMVAEMYRVLRDDGVCYFAGPNKFGLIEPHYRLPFLSWLPRPLADSYIRIAGKGGSGAYFS